MKKNKFNIVVFVIYLVLTLTGVLCHEIWRDEGQVWLVVRDLDLLGIIDHVRNEGHPLLWYLLVFPFAKLKLPVLSMQFLSVFFMLAAAGGFLLKSPFCKAAKIAVLFSAGFLYFLPVISRSYSLIPLFVFLLAIFYQKQKDHPYLYVLSNICLINTHVLMFGFCSALTLVFGYDNVIKNNQDKKKFILPFLLMLMASCSVAIYILFRPELNNSVDILSVAALNMAILKETLIAISTNLYAGFPFSGLLFALCIGVLTLLFWLENRGIFFISFFALLWQMYIYLCVREPSIEKVYTILLVLIFGAWVILNKKDLLNVKKYVANLVIIIIFAMSFKFCFYAVKNDILYPYSGSKAAANFILKNIKPDDIIISTNELTTAGVLAYLPDRKFYLHYYDDFYTLAYNKKFKVYKSFELKKPERFKDKNVYYIYSALGVPKTNKQIVFISDNSTLIATEYFFIIKDE